jgi:hypothetical protein
MPSQGADRAYRPFVFMLVENFAISMATGVVAYGERIRQPPLTRGDGRFFIGVSTRNTIFGPFLQLTPVYKDPTPMGFIRLDQPPALVAPAVYPYRFGFGPLSEAGANRPLLWAEVAALIGVPEVHWKRLHTLCLDRGQIDLLTNRMVEVNGGWPVATAPMLNGIPPTIEDRGFFEDADDDFLLTEYFGGDRDTYEANFLDHDPD